MDDIRRITLDKEPHHVDLNKFPADRGRPDAFWISHPDSSPRPFFSRFRLKIKGPFSGRFHVTADERYHLSVDNRLVYRGPERGDEENWYYETFELNLAEGEHEMSALVWSLGDEHAPFAQVMMEHGFLVIAADDANRDKLSTGHAAWTVEQVEGIEMIPRTATYGCGDRFRFVAESNHPAVEPKKGHRPYVEGAGDTQPTRIIRPAQLPDMIGGLWKRFTIKNISEPADRNTAMVKITKTNDKPRLHGEYEDLLGGGKLTIPAHSKHRVVIDLEDYVCAYWRLATRGGAGSFVRINFQEALWDDPDKTIKGNRDAVEGKYFCNVWHKVPGEGDEVHVTGGDQTFEPLWWLAGRYLELYIETGDEDLTIQRFELEESHYPVRPGEMPFKCSDPKVNQIVEICLRTLEMDMHQTYMDTPFYEQLMYVGDTRVEALCTMFMTGDNLLPRKATELFFWSRGARGITQSRYPSRNRQYIPPFSLFWVLMVEDQLAWTQDHAFARKMLPGVRSVLDTFEMLMEDGLMKSHPQWNFLDWIPGWSAGVPPQGFEGFNTTHNLQLVLSLEAAMRLEESVGKKSYMSHLSNWHSVLVQAIKSKLVKNGFLVDGFGVDTLSEHQHALASLTTDPELVAIGKHWYDKKPAGPRATYYFQHYRFEALDKFGRPQEVLEDIRKEWGAMVDLGLKTCLESPDPSRSDCHAWSSHPILHLQQAIGGLRMTGPFAYTFDPHLCGLDWVEAHVATGRGFLHARVEKGETRLQVPDGVKVWIPATRQEVVGPDSVLIKLN